MAKVSRHYERSFEAYLIRSRIPHLMVDDARRAVLPAGATLGLETPGGADTKLKSFDAVVYGPGADRCPDGGRVRGGDEGPHLLVEVKGRRVDLRRGGVGRRESWTTMDDIRGLKAWEGLFGAPFEGVLLFWYWLDGPVVNAMERETFRFEGRVYAHRAVRVGDYARLMRVRSPKWGTVNLSAMDFDGVGASLGALRSGGPGTPDPGGGVRDAVGGPVAVGAGGA
jgi:hypothetical protein